jgi:PPE-repeat protein
VVAFAQLRDVDLEPLATTAKAWERFAQALKNAAKDYDTGVVARVDGAGWQGPAADAARKEVAVPATRLKSAAAQAGSVAGFMKAGYEELRSAKQRLEDAIADASALRLRVGDDGSLRLPEPSPKEARDPDFITESKQLRQKADAIHDRFEEALRLATTADERLAGGGCPGSAPRVWKAATTSPRTWPAGSRVSTNTP